MKIVKLTSLEPALVITPDEVLRVDGDGSKPVLPSHLLTWTREAHWLRLALTPDFDPREYKDLWRSELIKHEKEKRGSKGP